MDRDEVEQLHKGDEVTWTDPDQGLCSKTLVLSHRVATSQLSECCILTDIDGGELQCFFSELS